jgi:hypothetical protein
VTFFDELGYSDGMPYADIDPTGVQWQVRSYFDVLNELLDLTSARHPAVVAIDGHSGSGKTTLADGLAALEPRAVVIHTDDLSRHHLFFPAGSTLTIPLDTSIVFVEGVGSARREARTSLNAIIWMYVREEVGRRRMETRKPHTLGYVDDRMNRENAFFAEHRPWQVADVLVAGALGQPAHNGRYGNVVTAPGPALTSR